jgi:dephospho-CoA kinase
VIGIVGGVGSGKSSVISGLAGFSLQIIDADRIGHQLLLRPEIRAALTTHFGPAILNAAGEIHRPALAAIVFGDTPAQQAARETLNQIVRPGIRAEILRQLQHTPPHIDAVILDAALLLESGLDQLCDHLIFIDTPEQLRSRRTTDSRGWSPEELRRRELSQWPLDRKRAACSHSIDNSGSLAAATSQLQQLLQEFLHQPVTSPTAE